MKSIVTLVVLFLVTQNNYSQEPFEKNFFPDGVKYHSGLSEKSQPMYNSLSDAYDVKYYKIDLEADNTSVYLSGNVKIGATVSAAVLDTFAFELHPDYTIDSVKVNGIVENFYNDNWP